MNAVKGMVAWGRVNSTSSGTFHSVPLMVISRIAEMMQMTMPKPTVLPSASTTVAMGLTMEEKPTLRVYSIFTAIKGMNRYSFVSDLKVIFCNKGFWLITLLCLMFYSAVFPFLKFATNLMIIKYHVSPDLAGMIPGLLPFGTILLTPLFGSVYDKVGKGATLMLIGSALLTVVHVLFALPVMNVWWFAVIVMILLGIAFSLVPSAMWPSVPKIIPMKQLGSAYAIIFYIQNIGLSMVPVLIGNVIQSNTVNGTTDYTVPMAIFAGFGVVAVIISMLLKGADKKYNYGLEQKNEK